MAIKTCKISGREFEITERDQEFYKKIGVPEPTLCPSERRRRRLAFRNERNLYPRKCDLSGEDVVSPYHAGASFPVYKSELWWGDEWDPNMCRHSGNRGDERTCMVWEYPEGVSRYGLYNMSGNVWEWCADSHDRDV